MIKDLHYPQRVVLKTKRWFNFSNTDNDFFTLTIITNVALFLISIVVIAVSLIRADPGFKSYVRYILLSIAACTNIIFIYYRHSLLSRILTTAAPFVFIFILPIFTGYIRAGMFIWFPFGMIIIGAASFLIFSLEKERFILYLALFIISLAVIFYDRILYYYAPDTLDLSFIYKENYLYYVLSKILLLFFLFLILLFFKVFSYTSKQNIERLNNELIYVNEHLECLVKQRNDQLELQNARIKDLAYLNAHRVRAYVARIMGLIQLSDMNAIDSEQKSYYEYLKETAHQLDDETRKISEKLYSGEE